MKKPRSRKAKLAAVNALPVAVIADEASLTTMRSQSGLLSRAWAWLQSRQSAGSGSYRLRVAETVSLGEKRFVAVVQVAGRDFLVAGGPSNIALLAQLDSKEPFEDVLHRTMTIPGLPAKRKRAAKRKPKPKPAAQLPSPAIAGAAAPAKRKRSAPRTGQESNGHAELESAPVMPSFDTPESFRYVIQNTITKDGNALGKPANVQNGRSETKPAGHWA